MTCYGLGCHDNGRGGPTEKWLLVASVAHSAVFHSAVFRSVPCFVLVPHGYGVYIVDLSVGV